MISTFTAISTWSVNTDIFVEVQPRIVPIHQCVPEIVNNPSKKPKLKSQNWSKVKKRKALFQVHLQNKSAIHKLSILMLMPTSTISSVEFQKDVKSNLPSLSTLLRSVCCFSWLEDDKCILYEENMYDSLILNFFLFNRLNAML